MIYHFANISIDEVRRELRRDGVVVPVEPKTFDLILFFMHNPGRMVRKRELLDALWPEQDVFENALNVCIHRARKALGDIPSSFIKTVARRGYRFTATIRARKAVSTSNRLRLAGREREIAMASDVIAQVRAGVPSLTLIGGGPGIGKSRLLQEIAEMARDEGVAVLWAHGDPHRGVASFALWRQILIAYAASKTDEALRAEMESCEAALCQLAPSLAARLHGKWFKPPASPLTRSDLYAAVLRFFQRAAVDRPILLCLDDLHDADLDSIDVLVQLLESVEPVPIAAVAAWRNSESDASARVEDLCAVARDHVHGNSVVLAPLDAEEVRRMLHELAAGRVPDDMCAAIFEYSGGLPLFVAEYWHYVVSRGLARRDGLDWSVEGEVRALELPPSVRSAIERRLAAIGETTRIVLRWAGLLGRAFDSAELAELCGDRVQVDEALITGLGAGLVMAKASEQYELCHQLYGEQLLAKLSEDERKAAHRRVATVLAGGLDVNPDRLPELAHHASEGADAETAEAAIDCGQRLAYQHFSKLAFNEAAGWFSRTVHLLERFHPERAVQRFGLLSSMGDALSRIGDEDTARRAFHEAAQLSQAEAASAKMARGERPVEAERLLTFIRAAIEVLSDQVPDPRQTEPAERERVEREVEEAARRDGDAAALAAALVSRRWLSSATSMPADRLHLSSQSVFLVEKLELPHLLQEARLLRIHDLLEVGRIHDAAAEIDNFAALAAGLGTDVYRWIATYLRAMQSHMSGRLLHAEHLAQEALRTASLGFADIGLAFFSTQMAGVRAYQGRMGELVAVLELFVRRYPRQPVGHANLAAIYAELGRSAEAEQSMARALDISVLSGPFRMLLIPHVAAALARVCAHLGDAATARTLYAMLQPWRGTVVVAPPAFAMVGPADAYLALLAQCTGEWQRAVQHYEEAIAICEHMGNWAVRAHIQYEYARGCLAHRSGRKARRLLAEAKRTAIELDLVGLGHWLDQVHA
ncbi:MAG TPA: AAA family ATPase [Terriglobales bacterium]|nr:AAA family ATPase [Terriglobales bacterium]